VPRPGPSRRGATARAARPWLAALALACAGHGGEAAPKPFTIAVLPDTQNMLDYRHQTAEGFPFDARQLFLGQMRYLAQRSAARGGDIVFVAAVGDVWQHQTLEIDPEHAARGFAAIPNPWFAMEIGISPKTRSVELPSARAGYEILGEAGIPFGVAPGNHDYDAMWSDARWPPVADPKQIDMTPKTLGMLHIGGLDNFRQVFGADTGFFRGKSWYVASHRGGASSAQLFAAGGYRFLHVALEMSPDDEVLAWASSVLEAHPGVPTIVSTHDYLSASGERQPNAIIDLAAADPVHNGAEALWQKWIRPHDQIFLVLCGHQHGETRRIDANEQGHAVVQLLADYQDRGQAAVDAGVPLVRGAPVPIGDGWLRLMTFDTAAAVPTLVVRTYSPHYRGTSDEVKGYAAWYRAQEAPRQSDAEFLAQDSFRIELADFRARFGPPRP